MINALSPADIQRIYEVMQGHLPIECVTEEEIEAFERLVIQTYQRKMGMEGEMIH